MELQFESRETQQLAESSAGCAKLLGQRDAAALCQRFCELAAAENLATVNALPGLELERLGNDGKFSIRISGSRKLVIEAVDSPGGDLVTITSVRVVGVREA